ncbi:hypothetical protein SAMN02745172_00213 [Pseudoxanthobacter soli DSM 19599]|uniref:DUF1488 domain-containing protein n=1 Tax=Pseudoxanthobacter soli DSM 19599 TaxID=1123029 RepID=A0A1M7Z5Q4_9HYPH|nr:hypothetical protein [Pseudoxanthobacter soli]SHO60205.1 hypothetical protein SAMN02745172_00213 [Pseudoxanthobacter soli DSM 19599]
MKAGDGQSSDGQTSDGPARAEWRADVDALAFRPAGHAGLCMVHRLAFRVLVGPSAAPEDCLALFAGQRAAFETAAAAKIARRTLAPEANFHLDSRDIRAALAGENRRDGGASSCVAKWGRRP